MRNVSPFGFLPDKGLVQNEIALKMAQELIKSDYETMIFTLRGKKVMVDYDLALLYEVPTKALKQQVKRNHFRFPEDFTFELSRNEKNELVTNCDRLKKLKHSSVNPYAFSEQGVAMLSSVLNSEKAILINIENYESICYIQKYD
jgi:hypothetical protein